MNPEQILESVQVLVDGKWQHPEAIRGDGFSMFALQEAIKNVLDKNDCAAYASYEIIPAKGDPYRIEITNPRLIDNSASEITALRGAIVEIARAETIKVIKELLT